MSRFESEGAQLSDRVKLDKYKQAFQEEAREILVDLESALLGLNQERSNMELVGHVFRALHTIKGSGAMFGFDDVADFTHNLENAFDEVRNGRMHVTSQLVDISLGALDQIKAMLDHPGRESVAKSEEVVRILAELGHLTGLTGTHHAEPAAVPPPAPAPSPGLPIAAGPVRAWRLSFFPGPELMDNGADPLLLLRELRQMGDLQLNVVTTAVPAWIDLNPECCYLGWEMTLVTAADADAIRDVFMFVEDTCELTISAATTKEGPAGPVSCGSVSAGPVSPGTAPHLLPSPIPARSETPSPSQKQAQKVQTHLEVDAQPGPGEPDPPLKRRRDDRDHAGSNIRVPTAKLDQFVDLVGELVTVQARLGEIATRLQDSEMASVSEEVERLTAALRENSMSIRMLPIRATFERFRRLVHDLARDLHKEVELTIEGADTEVDKAVIDQLNDPLMHLVRNSMDHGIEASDARLSAGKPAAAKVLLSARHEGANVLICVSDDGGGIDKEAVRARAVEKGLISADVQLTEAEIFALILTPGFSTAQQITDVSGRGVGMDVVRQRVEALQGTILITSKPGAGTSVTLRLPLTLAIIDGLLVRIGSAYFVLPLASTLECIELTRQDIEKANGKHVAVVRGEIIPYIRLREYFGINTERPEREQIMIAETEDGRCGFVVDEVLGDHQTVIKNLGRFYRNVPFVSGATILGNGSLALILDPNRIVQDAVRTMTLAPRGRIVPAVQSPAFDAAKDLPMLNSP